MIRFGEQQTDITEKYLPRWVKDTMDHKSKVKDITYSIISDLEKRAMTHDDSKLTNPIESQTFAIYTDKLHDTTYGSEEYKQSLLGMEKAIQEHYKNNRHHPEHFAGGISGMNLIDLVEMFSDWLAATRRHADGDFIRSLEINKERFSMDPQILAIFRNTYDLLEKERVETEKAKELKDRGNL